MHLDNIFELARNGRLYPGLILHGLSPEGRLDAAMKIARVLLCGAATEERACGDCPHCHRLDEAEEEIFHPDLHLLKRDLRTSTSAEATKSFLRPAYSAPFEARGQVFIVAEAETLSGEAADALLKVLEEPPERTPRHFMLLAASRLDLLPTLRSRSLSIFLGASEGFDEEQVQDLARSFGAAVEAFLAGGSAVFLLAAAEALAEADGWQDPRARRPWALCARAILSYLDGASVLPESRRRLLALANALLEGPRLRVRGIAHGRILEGLVSRHLATPGK